VLIRKRGQFLGWVQAASLESAKKSRPGGEAEAAKVPAVA
jgi:hypothetical protein